MKAITVTTKKASQRKGSTTRWGMSSSHLISHSPRETDTSCDALTRTGYGVGFSVTVPPRAAEVALPGRGAGWGVRPTVGPGDRHRRAAGPADQTRRDCGTCVPGQEWLSCEPAVTSPLYRGAKASVVLVGGA